MAKKSQITTRIIHWLMAVLIFLLLISGFYMVNAQAYPLYPWHKSLGVLAAIAIIFRLYWRSQQRWISSAKGTCLEKPVAFVHWLILALLVLMPLSGFFLSGFGGYGVALLGLEIIPSNFNEAGTAVAYNEQLSTLGYRLHPLLAIVLTALLSLHIVAALKHHFFDKNDTLRRMLGRM